MRSPGDSWPSAPCRYIVNWRVSSSFQTVTSRKAIFFPSGPVASPRIVIVFPPGSQVPSDVIGRVISESTHVAMYFLFAGSYPTTPCPWNGCTVGSLLKSVRSQRPPQQIVAVSTPLEYWGGAPGGP